MRRVLFERGLSNDIISNNSCEFRFDLSQPNTKSESKGTGVDDQDDVIDANAIDQCIEKTKLDAYQRRDLERTEREARGVSYVQRELQVADDFTHKICIFDEADVMRRLESQRSSGEYG